MQHEHENIIKQQSSSKDCMFQVQASPITNTQLFVHVCISVRKIMTSSSILKQIASFSLNAYLVTVLDAISSYEKYKILSKAAPANTDFNVCK